MAEGEARARALGTSVDTGLDSAQASESLARHGANRLPEPEPRTFLAMFLGALRDKTLVILMGAAALSIAVEVLQSTMDPSHSPHYIDGLAILVAVLIASGVTALNEARASKKFRELSALRADVPCKLLRSGRVKRMSVYDVVVGDVVYFDPGDRLPADGLLLHGTDVSLDQSTLTGESEPVDKDEQDLEMRGGTTVTGGSGAMLVTAVGRESEIGRLQLSLTERDEAPTPLQQRLSALADRIGMVGLTAAILTFVALAASGFLRGELPMELNLTLGARLLEFLIVAVTIIVVAVPEGLPLAVTISLAYSVQKMARAKNLVRKLASCETMGAATVICSDKTGTLTLNRMSVVSGWLLGKAFEKRPEQRDLDEACVRRISEIASVNSTAFIEEESGVLQYVGNPTECALLAWVRGWGIDWSGTRKSAEIVRQFGFSSDRKRMSTLVREGNRCRLLIKGAPEVILERSTEHLGLGGVTSRLEAETRSAIARAMEQFSSKGQRTLALAYRDLDGDVATLDAESLEQSLVFMCIVGIADPVRDDVKEAVASSLRAGVEVKMVTGDNRLTAMAIAAQIGLLKEGDIVLEGEDFRAMADDTVIERLPRLRVLARSVPSDKLRLVRLLKSAHHVVAVTGDGTNDAPALASADVGFSMGLTGTEVAKEASDIVLLDDNFASIVEGILWGRSIFENIRKFLQFQLTVNVVALTTAFSAAVLGFGIPLNTVQLLWVNLIMDTLAALALATEPPSKALLRQPPHGRHEPLITRTMWINILSMGVVMVTLLLLIMWTDWILSPDTETPTKLTFVFNAFVMMQVFNEFNARSTRFDRGVFRGLGRSPLFAGVLAVTVVAQVLIVQYAGDFFRTVPLSGEEWLKSILMGASILVVGAVLRTIGRLLPKRWLHPSNRDVRLPAAMSV